MLKKHGRGLIALYLVYGIIKQTKDVKVLLIVLIIVILVVIDANNGQKRI